MKVPSSKLKAPKKIHGPSSRRGARRVLELVIWSFLGALSFDLGTSAAAPASDAPADEIASFKLAPGFEANLFASEADGIVKPIQCRFDARGRLWVIGSTVYPQLEPGQVPNDKVIILEDTDGDGRADKSTVFADGLFIPTGLEIGDGGCYVGNSTELLHLRDTNGDGKADERRVLLRGFGTGDNHQNLNSFQCSPGGELWFSQGLHAHSRVETPWGVEKLDQAGIWRWRPRQLRLDPFFGSEMAPHNPWGFVFDDWGRMLVLAGNGHGIFDPLPLLMRGHRITALDQIWKDYRGRKLCGGDIVGNTHFPEDWQGVMLGGGFINNAIYALRIVPDGSSFTVVDREPLMTSSHGSFRPVDVKMGPDGAVYIADWYNPIIGHYQASFRHPDRDKLHGRIWRVTAKGRPLVKQPALVAMDAAGLLDQLRSNDRFTRLQARRLLADLDPGVVTNALSGWLASLKPEENWVEHHWLEALGVYESHEVVEPRLLSRLLRARDARARAYAAMVVARWQEHLADPLGLLRPLADDSDPRVRLAVVVAAANVPRPESIDVVLAATDQPVDKWTDYALRQAVYVRKPEWMPRFQRGELDAGTNTARLEFLVKADGTPDTLQAVRRLANAVEATGRREGFLTLLASVGDANDLARLLEKTSFSQGADYDEAQHARVLAALERASSVRTTRPAGDSGPVLKKLWQTSGTRAMKLVALRLARAWQVQGMELPARDAAFHPADEEIRMAGVLTLAALLGTNAATELLLLAAPARLPAERVAAAIGFAVFDPARASAIAADVLARDTNGATLSPLLAALLARKGGASSLASAVRTQPPARDAARLALRWLNAAGIEDRGLFAAFSAAAGVGGESLRATPAFVSELMTEVRSSGDASRGAAIFRRADLSCTACHAVGGTGGNTGPPLDGIGSGQPLDFIIGAVLEPNREVKESYEAIEVTTRDGDVHTGYRIRTDARELVLRDVAINQEVRLRRDQIAGQRDRGSIMPSGLVDQLTRQELRDLFRYLSELGKQ